jgi:hypothetical protein
MKQVTNIQQEVDLKTAEWRKSARCGEASHCVEVAFVGEHVAVRDTKNLQKPALVFNQEEWAVFVAGVRDGEFSGKQAQ